jgi:hypothetical protein
VAALTALGSPDMASFKTRILTVYLPDDGARGDRRPGQLACIRKILLVSPVDMLPSYPYMVSHVPWHPSLIIHALHLMKTTPKVLRLQF